MKIVIFGANGATGRLLAGQAVVAGHDVAAVTRRPANFPITHERLSVVAADVLDQRAVEPAVEAADVVLSTLGTPFTSRQVDIYSVGVRNIAQAMSLHGVKRLVVVSSSATEPHHHAAGGFLMNHVCRHAAHGGTRACQRSGMDDRTAIRTVRRARRDELRAARRSGTGNLYQPR